ncbi:MAG: hypothetical protein U0670_11115 [Anaerolineae bacterium]
MPTTPRRTLPILLFIVFLTAIVARTLPGARTIDDAFITFRYSRNLLEGQGFVYNPGVYTLGTTTPLFTLIMAVMGAIKGGQDFQSYAITLSAVADAITCTLLVLITRRVVKNDWIAALPGLLWAISPMSVTFAVGGMETSVNILWMIAAAWLYTMPERKPFHEIGMGICAALGVITRIDAVLWIAPLFGWQLIDSLRSRKLPLRTWIAAALMAAPWFLFAWGYFGSPLPNSISAKTVAYQMPPLSAFVRFLQTYATPFNEFDTFGSMGAMVGSIVYFILSLFGLLYAARALPRLLPLLIYPWLYLLVFSVANPLIFRWYLAPPLPGLMLSILLGLWLLIARPLQARPLRKMEDTPRPPNRIAPMIAGLIGLVWVFTSINAWTLHPDRPAPVMAWHQIELLYQQVGTMLRDEYGVTPETRVSSADIGAVGYFSRATIVDTVGLVTPELRRYYPVDPALIVDGQNYAIPPALIQDTQPEFLVTMSAFVELGLAQQSWFNSDYALIGSYPLEAYGGEMQVYQRR